MSEPTVWMLGLPAMQQHSQDHCLPEHEVSFGEHMSPGSSAFSTSHCEGDWVSLEMTDSIILVQNYSLVLR